MSDTPHHVEYDDLPDDGGDERVDPEVIRRRERAFERIVQWGDPVLRSKTTPVADIDDDVRAQVAEMKQIMVDAWGVGLAAPQIGSLRRLLVYRDPEVPDAELQALINPEIEWASEETTVFTEGCLSIRGPVYPVERPSAVRVRALDEHGAEVVIEAEGVHASCVQHEIDHLDGVLILDHLDRDAKREAIRALRERGR